MFGLSKNKKPKENKEIELPAIQEGNPRYKEDVLEYCCYLIKHNNKKTAVKKLESLAKITEDSMIYVLSEIRKKHLFRKSAIREIRDLSKILRLQETNFKQQLAEFRKDITEQNRRVVELLNIEMKNVNQITGEIKEAQQQIASSTLLVDEKGSIKGLVRKIRKEGE